MGALPASGETVLSAHTPTSCQREGKSKAQSAGPRGPPRTLCGSDPRDARKKMGSGASKKAKAPAQPAATDRAAATAASADGARTNAAPSTPPTEAKQAVQAAMSAPQCAAAGAADDKADRPLLSTESKGRSHATPQQAGAGAKAAAKDDAGAAGAPLEAGAGAKNPLKSEPDLSPASESKPAGHGPGADAAADADADTNADAAPMAEEKAGAPPQARASKTEGDARPSNTQSATTEDRDPDLVEADIDDDETLIIGASSVLGMRKTQRDLDVSESMSTTATAPQAKNEAAAVASDTEAADKKAADGEDAKAEVPAAADAGADAKLSPRTDRDAADCDVAAPEDAREADAERTAPAPARLSGPPLSDEKLGADAEEKAGAEKEAEEGGAKKDCAEEAKKDCAEEAKTDCAEDKELAGGAPRADDLLEIFGDMMESDRASDDAADKDENPFKLSDEGDSALQLDADLEVDLVGDIGVPGLDGAGAAAGDAGAAEGDAKDPTPPGEGSAVLLDLDNDDVVDDDATAPLDNEKDGAEDANEDPLVAPAESDKPGKEDPLVAAEELGAAPPSLEAC